MAEWQTYAALAVVVVAVIYLVRRLRRPSRVTCTGCGGECMQNPPEQLVEIDLRNRPDNP